MTRGGGKAADWLGGCFGLGVWERVSKLDPGVWAGSLKTTEQTASCAVCNVQCVQQQQQAGCGFVCVPVSVSRLTAYVRGTLTVFSLVEQANR